MQVCPRYAHQSLNWPDKVNFESILMKSSKFLSIALVTLLGGCNVLQSTEFPFGSTRAEPPKPSSQIQFEDGFASELINQKKLHLPKHCNVNVLWVAQLIVKKGLCMCWTIRYLCTQCTNLKLIGAIYQQKFVGVPFTSNDGGNVIVIVAKT